MVAVTTIFSTVVYLNVEKSVLSNEYETSQKVLNQMKFNIDFMDEMVKNICLSIYYNEDVKSLMNYTDDETFEQMRIVDKLSKSVVASNSYIHSIYIYNNLKKVYYSTYNSFKYEDPDLISLIRSHSEIPVLKPVFRKTETYRSGDLIKYSNVLTYFMYEMTDSENNMQGAIILNIKLDWLLDNIKAINMTGSKRQDEIFIVNEKDEFIRNTEELTSGEIEMEEYIAGMHKDVKEKGEAGKTGIRTIKIGSKNHILSSIPIQRVDWTVYRVQPYDMVFNYINNLKRTIIIITVIVLILIFIASYTLSRGLYKPFEGLLRLVGFNGATPPPGAKPDEDGDEFSYLQKVYKNSLDQLDKYLLEKRSNVKVIKTYFLRKLLFYSSSITRKEFESNSMELNISLNLDEPIIVILLLIDRHKKFEKEYDVKTRELLKVAITNITAEILSECFKNEIVEMKHDEIAIIVNAGSSATDVYGQLAARLKKVQEKVLENYKISFTAILSEQTDNINELTILYNRAVNHSQYRFIFGLMSIITPDMLKRNLSTGHYDYDFDKQKKLVEEMKQGDFKSVQNVIESILEEAKKLEYNNMMLSLAHLVNTVKNTIYEINQTRREPINTKSILSGYEIFELETMDEFKSMLLDVLQQVTVRDETMVDKRDVKIAEAIRRIILESYFDYNLSASGIAEKLRMSPSKISKVFKENMSMSIPEYINSIRLAKAVEWMENSRLSVGEIMHKVGIENESYFYKIFKAKYGTTPREYIAKDTTK